MCPKDLQVKNWEFDPTKSCDLIGAAVCEANGTNELATSFFASKSKKPGECDMEFPQEPLRQSYIINYPILCYKTNQPDDKSIAIVHLADNIP